jgi:hypothetical protein
MDQLAGVTDLESLLSVAVALRQLANDYLYRGDQTLYLLTAEALERRAEWLAFTLPQEGSEILPQERGARPDDPQLHKPVDLTI